MERASEPVSNKENCQLCEGREILFREPWLMQKVKGSDF